MSIINKLATSLGHRDEVPNQELAAALAKSKDKSAINELVANLSNQDKGISSDCIKVLYEIGERDPKLIAKFAGDFAALLNDKNNRMVWGAMTALNTIATENPKGVFALLPQIIDAMEQGSVITKDNGVGVLAKLSGADAALAKAAFPKLLDQLDKCPIKQLPQYAEKALVAITARNKKKFAGVLSMRYGELEKDSQKKRIDKVLKSVQ